MLLFCRQLPAILDSLIIHVRQFVWENKDVSELYSQDFCYSFQGCGEVFINKA